MNNAMVKLRQLTCDNDVKLLEYEVSHNNGETTVTQNLKIGSVGSLWCASMDFKDMPDCSTAKDAAHKLGDWMSRLGEAIKNESHKFDSIDLG